MLLSKFTGNLYLPNVLHNFDLFTLCCLFVIQKQHKLYCLLVSIICLIVKTASMHDLPLQKPHCSPVKMFSAMGCNFASNIDT
jgi:hypothetical protein